MIAQDASERAALLHPGVLSDGQFYSPPESVAGIFICLVKDFSYSPYTPVNFTSFKRGRGKGIIYFLVLNENCIYHPKMQVSFSSVIQFSYYLPDE